MARQQRRMNVDRSQSGNIQDFLRKQLAERRRHAQVGRKAAKRFHAFRALDAFRLKDRDARRLGRFLHRAGGELVPAPFGLSGWQNTPTTSYPLSISARSDGTAKSGVPMNTILTRYSSVSSPSSSSNSSRDMIST